MRRYVPVVSAVIQAIEMTDRELQDAVFCGGPAWVVAAIALGRRTPPDLAGNRHAYGIPRPLPWHPPAAHRRWKRLRALLMRAEQIAADIEAPTGAGVAHE